MADADLLVIVPSRGRPGSVRRVVDAWLATGAYGDGARLVFALDADDPKHGRYWDNPLPAPAQDSDGARLVSFVTFNEWRPMVAKLNECAAAAVAEPDGYFALGFAGDDHLPRTPGWAGRYLAELRDMGTGIVYGDDRVQGARLPTQWAMTADIVRALGRMVPAPVEHLYCDNSIRDLGRAAGCLHYLPDVVIEHMHPIAGRGMWDDQYRRVNSVEQYAADQVAYERWRAEQMPADVATVAALRGAVALDA